MLKWSSAFLNIYNLVLIGLFVIATILFFTPRVQENKKVNLLSAERKILSVANGRIFPHEDGRVVKISTPEGLWLEIYKFDTNRNPVFFDRLALLDKRDALIQIQARARNLALKDMDKDLVYEIIAPTYSHDLKPNLQMFRYNKDSQKFESYIE